MGGILHRSIISGFAIILFASVLAIPAFAQEAMPDNPPETSRERPGASEISDPGGSSDIVITGSLIRGLPKEYVASPVFTYGQADIVQSGAGSLSEYMLTIPQNFTGDLSDFGTSAAQIGSTLGAGTTYNQYDAFAGFALRGLASDATLTLLNGRRMAPVGMIEASTVSVIPSALIERIDVISDGASATYSADAVAGVVNIVTRKIEEGVELRLRSSATTQTGSKNWEASGLTGHSWDGGHVYGMAMYQRREAFIEDPILVSNTPLQITQLPNEKVSGFYGGLEQEFGDFTFSVDGSRFQRNRDAVIRYIDEPEDNRFYDTRTTGYSAYSNLHWQGGGSTSLDLNVDYGRNTTRSQLFYGLPPFDDPSTGYKHKNTLFVVEFSGQTALANLPGGSVLVAAGAQYRKETMHTDAAIFFHLDGGEREVKSVFGEINLPLVGTEQNIPFVRSLSVTGALRYEDLGFDDALAPKVGVRWQIDEAIALRGTYARSFLVPRFRDTIGIAEQVSFWNYAYDFLDPADQNPLLPRGNALVMYRSGANPGLKTQNADTFTLGVDLTPAFVPGLTLKTGYYRIKISGRIVTPSQDDSVTVPDLQAFNVANPAPELVERIVNNPVVFRWFATGIPFVNDGGTVIYSRASDIPAGLFSQVQVIADIRPQNFAVESTDGLDFELAYDAPLLGGTTSVHLTGQYILNLDLTASGGETVSRLDGYAQPADLRLNGTFIWGRNGYSIGTVVNYVDGFTDNRPGEPQRKVGSYTTASLFFGFDLERLTRNAWLKDSEVQLVVANLFDTRPPRIADSVLGFDPYNTPPNPRSIGLVMTKRL